MKLKNIIITLGITLFALSLNATTIGFASGLSTQFVDSGATPLANGNLIRIGNFASGNAFVSANSGDFATLDADFTALELSGTPVIGSIFGNPGRATGQGQDNVIATLDGLKVYMWVFNAATTGAATEWTILESSTWAVFPAQGGGVADSANLNMADANITALHGSYGAGVATLAAAVPEPSTYAAIFGTAVLGIALLRRRRMNKA